MSDDKCPECNGTGMARYQNIHAASPKIAHSLQELEDIGTAIARTYARHEAGRMGYTGNPCSNCGGWRMRRNGTCEVCDDCGTTTGCS